MPQGFTRYGEDSEDTDSGAEDVAPALPPMKKEKKAKKTKAAPRPAKVDVAESDDGDAMEAFLDGEDARWAAQRDAEDLAQSGREPDHTVDASDDEEDDAGSARAMYGDFFGDERAGGTKRPRAASAAAAEGSAATMGTEEEAPKKKRKKKKKKKKKLLAPGEVELTQAEKKALHEAKRTKGKKEVRKAARREHEADAALAESSGVAAAMAASRARDKGINASEKKEKAKWNAYNVFVGQLPYSATSAMVKAHFEERGVLVKAVRMRTDKVTGKFKGTAFVELHDARSQARALRLHHTTFLGHVHRRGGGGRAEEEEECAAPVERERGELCLPKGEGDEKGEQAAEDYEGEDNPFRKLRKKKERRAGSARAGALQAQGRVINVERTVGGGGKGEARYAKLGMLRDEQGGYVRTEIEALIDQKVAAVASLADGLRRSDVDERTVEALCSFPRKAATAILDEFSNTVDERVKNRPAWLMGMLTKYRDKIGRGDDLFPQEEGGRGDGGRYGADAGRYGDERSSARGGRGRGGAGGGRGRGGGPTRGSGAAEFQAKRKKWIEDGKGSGKRGAESGGHSGGRGRGAGRGGGRGSGRGRGGGRGRRH